MGTYESKCLVIEAVEVLYIPCTDKPRQFYEAPEWLRDAFDTGKIVAISAASNRDASYFLSPDGVLNSADCWHYVIRARTGFMIASPSDKIICGITGELYSCPADIFKASYNPI